VALNDAEKEWPDAVAECLLGMQPTA